MGEPMACTEYYLSSHDTSTKDYQSRSIPILMKWYCRGRISRAITHLKERRLTKTICKFVYVFFGLINFRFRALFLWDLRSSIHFAVPRALSFVDSGAKE